MNTEIKPENEIVENKQQVELEDKTYRLEEMSDAMKASIENIDEVMRQQLTLIDVVSTSDKSEEFEDFIKDVTSQIDKMAEQKAKLNFRLCLLNKVLELCRAEQNNVELTTMLLTALGVFED